MQVQSYIAPYLVYSKAKGRTDKTIREHTRLFKNVIVPALGDRELMSLKRVDAALLEALGRNFGEHGAQRSVCLFRRLMNFVEDSGEPLPFDWRSVNLPRVPLVPVHSLSDDEMQLVRNNIDVSNIAGLRERALIELLYDSGMRIGEAVSIDKKDVDWVNLEIEITNCKTHEKQKVYFTANTAEWMKRYIEARKDDLECLFVSGRGRLLEVTSRNYICQLSHRLNALGLKKRLHHHLFRKTYTTNLLTRGVNIKAVQILARHKSERTTLRHYAAVGVDQAKYEYRRVMK
jgi:integrase/recombinase XerD